MAENDASLNAPPGLAGQVDFTDIQTAAAVVCERPNCSQQRFPPGTKLYFIPGRNSSHGRYICKECWNYYAEKLKNGALNLWQCALIIVDTMLFFPAGAKNDITFSSRVTTGVHTNEPTRSAGYSGGENIRRLVAEGQRQGVSDYMFPTEMYHYLSCRRLHCHCPSCWCRCLPSLTRSVTSYPARPVRLHPWSQLGGCQYDAQPDTRLDLWSLCDGSSCSSRTTERSSRSNPTARRRLLPQPSPLSR